MASSQQSNTTQAEEPIPSPSHLDGISYLYGHPLRNSLSPLLHRTIFGALGLNWAQIPLSVATPSSSESSSSAYSYTRSPPIQTFLAHTRSNPKFVGASVTMPWKVSIMPHLDALTENAKRIGACNTIFVLEEKGGRVFVGTNTDCVGIREALLQNAPASNMSMGTSGVDYYRDKPALIIGGGGTARAAVYTLRRWLRCSRIYVVNRDRAEVEALLAEDRERSLLSSSNEEGSMAELIPITEPAEVQALEPPAAIVSGIPNYPPKTLEEIKARAVIEAFLRHPSGKKGVILEMCYHPALWTEIAELAANAGWNVILGTEAMIWQGLEQSRLWTGRDIVQVPGLVQKVKDVIAGAVTERERVEKL